MTKQPWPADRAALEASGGGFWRRDVLDFAFIRNMHFPTPEMLAELAAELPDLLRNYGSNQETLDALVADFVGCDAHDIVALNGLSQIYPWLADHLALLPAGDILVPAPTFGEYCRVFPNHIAYRDDFTAPDLTALAQRAARALIFVNPNNPTGTTLSSANLLRLSDQRRDVRIIVDESFIRFSGEPSLVSLTRSDRRDNLVVLASLSKDLGLPGVRLGYAFSTDRAFIAALRKAIPIWNLNSIAERTLELATRERAQFERSLRLTVADRAEFAFALAQLDGVVVRPSGANFMVASLPCDPAATAVLADHLLADHGILVKDISPRIGDGHGHLRLAVRTRADHARLVAALEPVLRLTAARSTR